MKKLTLLLLLIISLCSYAQYSDNNFSVSFYTSMKSSRGAEVRGYYDTWYLSFQAEQFIKEKKNYFNWGFSLGLFNAYDRFTLIYGLRVGFMNIEGDSKPSFGLEAESNYSITEDVFIGVRLAYDIYYDSLNNYEPEAYELIRPFLKIGYKF